MTTEFKTTLKDNRILITGGAGFIGSNMVEHFLGQGNEVICLDNLSTGYIKNIEPFFNEDNFTFIDGDIRDPEICQEAARGCDYIFHQAALGSVPRSVNDPITTNAVNIDGFVNMLIASRDQKVTRFIYAASSSTYGDSEELPKVEDRIGNPLSPYAVTKYVNELYARVFSDLYDMECIGLRYFNVFGKRQDPNGAYAAVIPLWVKQLINHMQPVINGDGSYSRDFTYIDNVIQANELAAVLPTELIIERLAEYRLQMPGSDGEHGITNMEQGTQNIKPTPNIQHPKPFSEIFNVAFGGNTTLNELFEALSKNLSHFDGEIAKIEPIYGPFRTGDIPHSMASIDKAKIVLGYDPQYDAVKGFERACEWYFDNLK
ncbi:MAG TPA: SDR family oxidoreductase [Bacteroidales bacterium]|nr:SDR family oxidoreductase [Bacteroidales bacterium]